MNLPDEAVSWTIARKSDPSVPVPFVVIDEEMYAHFGIPYDMERWCMDWFCYISVAIELGGEQDWKSFQDFIDTNENDIVPTAMWEWLNENFILTVWSNTRYN